MSPSAAEITVDPQLMPSAIRDSWLMRVGGYAVFGGFPDVEACTRLLAESSLCLQGASACAVAVSDDEEVRGGSPSRRFISAGGGDQQRALYHDRETARFFSGVCNAPVRPTGETGTYTYYARPGDHLSLHRDIETCDIAVVTCLMDRHGDGPAGGITRLYPGRLHEPLSRIRATPDDGAVRVGLSVGSTMVLLGGLVPHLIEPLGIGELRIVSILCFHVLAD